MPALHLRKWSYYQPRLEGLEARDHPGPAELLMQALAAAAPLGLVCLAPSGMSASPYAVTGDNHAVTAGASLAVAPGADHVFTPPLNCTLVHLRGH